MRTHKAHPLSIPDPRSRGKTDALELLELHMGGLRPPLLKFRRVMWTCGFIIMGEEIHMDSGGV